MGSQLSVPSEDIREGWPSTYTLQVLNVGCMCTAPEVLTLAIYNALSPSRPGIHQMQDAQMIVSRWKQPPIDMQFGLRKVRATICDNLVLICVPNISVDLSDWQ